MRTPLILTLAAGALAATPAYAANENLPPVGCIVTHTDRINTADLVELVNAGFAPTTKSGKVTMTVVGQVVQSCRRRFGWGKPREDAAVQYFAMHVRRADAVERGRRFGLTEAISAGYVAGLAADAQASYGSGKVTPELNRAAFAYLEKSGVKLEGLKTEDVQALGQAFNLAVYTAIGQANAEKAYAGR